MKYAFIIVIGLLPTLLTAQNISDDAVLASVGNEQITVGEFRLRYTLGVFPYKDQERLAPVIKVQFLYSLIAERLLMAHAQRLGFDAEDRFRRNRRLAEEMFMRDRLYRDSVRAQVDVSESEIHARFVEEQQRIQFDFLFNTSESEINNLHRLLKSGIPFDTLLTEQRRSDANDDLSARESDVETPFRAHIDSLAPGTVSRPLRGSDGWYLVRKMDYGNPFRSEYELQKRSKRLENQLRMEKEATESMAFVRRLWQGREARFEERPYRDLGQALLQNYRAQSVADTSDMLPAGSEVFDSLRAAWALRLEEPFLHIDEKPHRVEGKSIDNGEHLLTGGGLALSLGDALDRMEAFDLRLQRKELSSFSQYYSIKTRDLADRFIMTSEAIQLGLDQHPDVLRDMAMWSASGLAQMIPELLWEQFIANEDSVWNYYASRPDIFGPPVEVKIVEVFKRDEGSIQHVVKEFRNGADLHAIAAAESERPGAANRNGELGYFPVTQHGLIGRTAFGLGIADAAGPLRTSEGFSFFQLIDKRYPGRPISGWNALRDTVSTVARPGLMRARTDVLLRQLARQGGIRVDMKLLDELPVASMQMFTIRSLGFGGRIPAVPGVMPLHDAVMEGMGGVESVAP